MYILGYAIYIVLHHSIHNVSYCDRVKGRSLVRDPNSGIFHDLVKGSTLACSPRTFMGSVALALPVFLLDFFGLC